MKKALLILLCALIFCLGGCDSSQSGSVEPSTDDSWQPYYTGEEREWNYERPWDWDQSPDAKREFNQDQSIEAATNLGNCTEPDFAGIYTNDSGTLTVLVTDPTVERARYYGELCKVGVWIVEAEYTEAELYAARDETAAAIEQWIENNPEASMRLDSWGISSYQNRAVFHLSGNDGELMQSQLELPGCVALEFYETAAASDTAEIPWEPNFQWNSGVISAYLDRAEFPVGVKNINITLENRSDGNLLYGQSYAVEKYVDNDWIDVSGNIAFTAVGYGLEEYDKETFFINTEYFPEPLGVGLYRITGSDLRYAEYGADTSAGQDYKELGKYVLEFAVTEDAESAPEPVDTIYNTITEKEDWQWYGIWDMIDEQPAIPTYAKRIDGPFFVYMVGNGNHITEEPTTQFILDVFDRSTGNKLTSESLTFSGDFSGNTITDRSGNLFIRTDENAYCISVAEGEVNIISGVQFPDEDIPYPPVSTDIALDGDLTIQMESEYYSTDAESIAVLLSNNTDEEMTVEHKRSNYGIYKLEAMHSYFTNCWYSNPEEPMPEELLFMEPDTLTIAPGETYRFEESLEHWTYENGEGEKPLGRGLYQLIFSQITVKSGDLSEKVSFTVEFAIE